MKRRAFLGFLGGAAAAGPKLAEGLASSVNIMPPPPSSWGGAVGTLTPVGRDPTSVASRVLELRKLIKGDGRNEAKERRQAKIRAASMVERYRLDSLRSVSPQHKFRMLMEGETERDHRMQALWWEDELNSLLEVKLPF